MSYSSAEETKIVGEFVGMLNNSKFAVFPDFVTQVHRFLVKLAGSARVTRNKWLLVCFAQASLGRCGGLVAGFLSLLLRRLSATLSTSFFILFPIASINGLCQCSELRKCGGFSYPRYFIFDAGGKSAVELVSESTVIPSRHSGESIKLD